MLLTAATCPALTPTKHRAMYLFPILGLAQEAEQGVQNLLPFAKLRLLDEAFLQGVEAYVLVPDMLDGVWEKSFVLHRGVAEGHLPTLEFQDRLPQAHTTIGNQDRGQWRPFCPCLGRRGGQPPGASKR